MSIVDAMVLRNDAAANMLLASGRYEVTYDGCAATGAALEKTISNVFFLNRHHDCAANPRLTEPSPAAFKIFFTSSCTIVLSVDCGKSGLPQLDCIH